MLAISRTKCFSKIIRVTDFVVIFEFERFREDLENGSMDFFKTLHNVNNFIIESY